MEKSKNMKNKKQKKNKKGFTLIELLAVIIILGILLIIAVPSISKYIENSRKSTYVNAVRRIVDAVSTSVNALEYPLTPNINEAIIVPFTEASLEKESSKTKSPYGNYISDKSYVVVSFDGNGYKYYVVALDDRGYAIPFVNAKDLTTSSITSNSEIISDNIYSLSQIAATQNNGFIDTVSMTMKQTNKIGNIIKVKLYETIYSIGNIVQLKDSSKWYVINRSDENSKTVDLVSYYHMDTLSHNYGKQSNSKTTPIKVFDLGGGIEYTSSDIYSVAEGIVASTQVEFTKKGLDVTGATFSMPTIEDFSCTVNYGVYTCNPALTYLSNNGDGGFWTKDNNGTSMVLAISNGRVAQTSPHYGSLSTDAGHGIRVVIKGLLKTNIDKTATKALN